MAEIVLEGKDDFIKKLQAITAALRGPIAMDAVTEGAGVIQFHAQLNADRVFSDRQEGKLRNSIIPKVQQTDTGAEAEIGPERIYGRIQEFGGTIRPVHAKALHFKIDGQDIFVKKVTLPPRPYLTPAALNHQQEVVDVMAAAINDALEEFGS